MIYFAERVRESFTHDMTLSVGSLGKQGERQYVVKGNGAVSLFSSVAQSCPTLCDHMNRSTPGPPCSSWTPGVHPNPCPLCRWCHPTISSSTIPFSSCPQFFPASGSFQMSHLSSALKFCQLYFVILILILTSNEDEHLIYQVIN